MESLTLLTFLPLLGALVLLLIPGERTSVLRSVAIGTTALTAILGAILFVRFDGSQAGMQGVVSAEWFQIPGAQSLIPIQFKLGVDGISILMVVLTAVIMPIVALSAGGHIHTRVKEFLVWLLVMETGMLGTFLSLDLVLFYVFWEVSLVPLYFIIGIWGGEKRIYATIKFFLFTMSGSLLMLVAVLYLIYTQGHSDVVRFLTQAGDLPFGTQTWLFAAFAIAFAIKVPVLPFHTWLADAHTQAPTSGSVVLAAVMLKMGTYGLLRFCIAMFPAVAVSHSSFFMALGAIGIVYGAFLAMAQTDLKRLVACSSVSHLGFVVLGLFAMTQAGLRGSVLQMVNHGVSTGLLFLLVGFVYERRLTRQIAHYGGLAASMPIFALLFVFAVLSSVGLPGLNGFVGEYLILLGSFEASPLWAVIGVTGVIFGAIYLLSATRRVLFGPIVHEENRTLRDVSPSEIGLCVPVVVLAIWIGVAPGIFLDRTSGTLDALTERIELVRDDIALGQLEAAPNSTNASAAR